MGAASMIVLILAGLSFGGIAILVSRIFNKGSKNKQKGEPYECGVPTQGKTWMQLNVGYYLFALIFLIFDIDDKYHVPMIILNVFVVFVFF